MADTQQVTYIVVTQQSTYLTVSPSTAIIRLISFWFGLLGDLQQQINLSILIIFKLTDIDKD